MTDLKTPDLSKDTTDHEFSVWQNGLCVAAVSAPTQDAALAEVMHYAMVYAQDGPVEVRMGNDEPDDQGVPVDGSVVRRVDQ